MSDLETRAREFATRAHAAIDHRRKYTLDPYIVHPAAVADIVRSVPHSEAMLADSSGEYRPICYVVVSGERYHGDGYDVDCIEVTQDAINAAHEHWEAP